MAENETIIADAPPNDGREWDCQCARCGSSAFWLDCDWCAGDGHDAFDDDWDEDSVCDMCNGTGGYFACISSPDWCVANPLPGRQEIERGNAEWFVVAPPA